VQKPAPKPVEPEIVDFTHVKAQPKNENLRMDEVQKNIGENLIKNKD
jgi:hypothetical protein